MPERKKPEWTWTKDIIPFLKGWQVLVRGKLYYDPNTRQYYDNTGKWVSYGTVERRFNFDPMNPQTLFTPSQSPEWLTPRTQEIMKWQATGGERPAALAGAPPPEEDELDKQVKQARRIADLTGRPFEEILNSLLGLPAEEKVPGVSPYEQWNMQFQEWQAKTGLLQKAQERQYQSWVIEQNLKAQQHAEAAERFAAMTKGEPQPDWAGMSKTYEEWRNRLMQELSGPEDWITKWQVQNQQNPYQGPETTPADEAARVGEEVKKWDAMIKTQKDIIKRASQDPEVAVSHEDLLLLKGAEQAKENAERSLVDWQRKDIELGKSYPTGSPVVTSTYQPGGEGGITEVGWGANEPPRPTMPPAPSWLRALYPQLGERLPERGKARAVPPPSGQMWTALTPSQRAGWGGYVRYTGASPEDLLAQTEMMLPRTPRVPSGWMPARQMA